MMIRKILICAWSVVSAVGAQAQLVFEPASHDFGSVREVDGPVSYTFMGVNRGDEPVVLLDVVTSCGCTVPEFSKRPVLPGSATRITVTYDPANRPGAFSKELAVYSSERRKIATLTVAGEVVPRPKSLAERYPVDAGGGVRLSAAHNAFSYITLGREVHAAVEYVNTSDSAVSFRLRPKEASGYLRVAAPQRIAAGESGSIDLAYRIPVQEPHYGTVNDVLEVEVAGRSNGTVLTTHGIAVDDPAAYRGKPAPAMRLSSNIVRFGTLKHRTAAAEKRTFELTNDGTGELIVRAVESKGRVRTSLQAGQRIAPGKSLTVEVSLCPQDADYGPLLDRLTIIANDPARPMRQVRVVAVVER
ncbi:MAG: DUF1573 domain-containing protein [Alistipes senegalensis]|nr:DUF1573 domain-containing protein [Bacteroides cellulosilyticus]MCM1352012.1 DUF1573 domain-containing protein [Alistipes senegalensis]